MRFGIFDHIDDSGLTRAEQLEERLRLIEQYDRDGFYAYHLAEHHGTPLGLVGSPNVFLAAVAQRTRRLRLGALVNVLPLYHPVRLIEEWCLLDQLSGGRLELGVGRGASPIEASFYGVATEQTPELFEESYELLTSYFSARSSFSHHGRHYTVSELPLTARPLQTPHPPMWFGASRPDRAGWCAERSINVMSLVSAERTRVTTDGYRERWQELGRAESELPYLGVNRHIILADTEREALRVAERVYPRFKASFEHLWREHGTPCPPIYPERLGELLDQGGAFVGTPEGARQYVADQTHAAGINYMTADVAFGGITFAEASRTASLFATEVTPTFAGSVAELSR